MKNKSIVFIAYTTFWLSVFALFCIAGSSDSGQATLSQVVHKGSICLVILFIDAIVVTRLSANGKWRC